MHATALLTPWPSLRSSRLGPPGYITMITSLSVMRFKTAPGAGRWDELTDEQTSVVGKSV